MNGEAIYATRPWLIFGEGPTRDVKGGGFSEHADQKFNAQDIRFTQSKHGTALYAIALGWPERDLTIRSMRAEARGPEARVALLGHGPIAHRLNEENQIVLSLPAQRPCDYAFAFRFTGFKTALHPNTRFEQPDAVRLEPAQATCEGKGLCKNYFSESKVHGTPQRGS